MTNIQTAIHRSITEKGLMQKAISVMIEHAKFCGKLKRLKEQNDFECELRQFTESEQFYKHNLSSLIYTDGIQHLAEKAGAYWLIDLIASVQYMLKNESFQTWDLKVNDFNRAEINCTDGNDNHLYSQDIPFTDFPLDEIRLFVADNTLMLPSEY